MKKIFVLVLSVLIFTGCGVLNNNKTENNESQLIEENKKEVELKNEKDENPEEASEEHTLDSYYKKVEGKLNNKELTRETFNKLIGYYNPNILKGGVFGISIGSGDARVTDDKINLSILNNFNIVDISKFVTSDDVIKSGINNKNYKIGNSGNGYFYFLYNDKKDYLFSLNTFYEINGVCLILDNKIESFKDFSGESVSDSNPLSFEEHLSIELEKNRENLKNYDYKNFISNTSKINNKEYVYLGLLSILEKYKDSNYSDNSYSELFNKNFDKYLSPDYSYEEFTLYLMLNNKEESLNSNFCDNFNKEYFLGK